MPQVSVIIPTKNRPAFLHDAALSVLAQDFTDLELIIVNDGETLSPATSLAMQDPRLRILENNGQGAVSARNRAVENSNGTFIAFLDDDDIWIDPSHISAAVEACNCGADFTFANGMLQFPGEQRSRLFAQTATRESLMRDNTILVSAICYRRALHDTLGIFDINLPYYWDWDWYLRVSRHGFVLRHLQNNVVNIRIHPQNMSGETTLSARQSNLSDFATKHELGSLQLKNHTDFV